MMRTRPSLAALVVIAVGAAVVGCSRTGDPATGGEAVKEATIGVIAPRSGFDATMGKGVAHAVELAARQANAAGTIPGWRLKVVALDDKGEEADAKAAAQQLAADPSVVGVVGSIFSGSSSGAAPVLAKAKIVQVSPTSTDPVLTRGPKFGTAAARQFPTFFRVCPPDDFYAPALARTLAGKKITKVATIDDGTEYGQGFVAAFARTFTASGGKVIAAGAVDPETGENRTAVAKAKAAAPQAVVFGGVDSEAAPLSVALKSAGVKVPLAGGDGVYTPGYLPNSGIDSAGDLSMLGGSPPESSERGRAYLAAYRAQRFDAPVVPESPLAYDAARSIIAALATSLPRAANAQDARAATVQAMGSVTVDGLDGPISFDAYGEVKKKTATVYRVSGGEWVIDSRVASP